MSKGISKRILFSIGKIPSPSNKVNLVSGWSTSNFIITLFSNGTKVPLGIITWFKYELK